MKKTIPVVILLHCLFCPSFAQEIFFAPDVSERELLETLFEGVWNTRHQECVWVPNLAEQFQFGGTEDGFLYTQVDTTFDYETSYGKYRRIITTTYLRLGGEKENCHACAPVFSELELRYVPEENTYQLQRFNKFVTAHGAWGEPGAVSLQPIGGDIYLTRLDGVYQGQGILVEDITLIHQGRVVLRLHTTGDNEDGVMSEADRYHFESDFQIDTEKQLITLHTTGTEQLYEGDSARVIPVDRTIRYQWAGEGWEKVCP